MIEFLSNLPNKTYIGLFLSSLFVSYWLTPISQWLTRGIGLGASNIHNNNTPSLVGIAVSLPLIAGISLLLLLRNQVSENMYMIPLQMRGLFICTSLLFIMGLASELLQLRRWTAVILHLLPAGLAYYFGFRLDIFYGFESVLLSVANVCATILWILSVIHILDTYDRRHRSFAHFAFGLTISIGFFAFYFDQFRTIVICCLLAGSILGILSHNPTFRPSLGRSGTYCLGFTLSVTMLQSNLVSTSGWITLGSIGLLAGVSLWMLRHIWIFIAKKSENRQLENSHELICQALLIQLKLSSDAAHAWSLLCQGAALMNFKGLFHYSAVGKLLHKWGESTQPYQSQYSLKCSGGHIAFYSEDEILSNINVPSLNLLLASYDNLLERQIIAHVKERNNKIRLVIVNRYFSGMSATGQIIEELAQDLYQRGIDATVLTSDISYENNQSSSGRNEIIDGVHIHRLPATYFGRSSSVNRIMDFVFFYLRSFIWIIKTPSKYYTHLMAFTDPPLIAVVGLFARRLNKWKFIYNVQDLYPETALALGAMRNGPIYKLCSMINVNLLQRSDAIITISEKLHERVIRQLIKTTSVEIIPNWADGEKIKILNIERQKLCNELNIKNCFTLIYAGNMGLAQEIDALVAVVNKFSGRRYIQLIFMGGGVRRRELERAAKQCDNILFLPYQSKSTLCRYLAVSDMGIVTLSAAMESLAIPTRTYTYLAAGLPLLTIGHRESELKSFSDAGLGVHFASDKVESMISFLEGDEKLRSYGSREAIRAHFIAHFERKTQTEKYWHLLNRL